MEKGHSAPSDPIHRFSTSWLLPPALLFTLRALFSAYAFLTLFYVFAYDSTHGNEVAARRSFSYFTYLTYWGLAFYLAFSAAHTASYWLTGTSFLARWPRILQRLHSLFYSTVVVFPFLVTSRFCRKALGVTMRSQSLVVYWAILFRGSFYSTFTAWSNVSEHALNSAFAFSEVLLPCTEPLPFLHLIPLIILLGLYLALAYVTYATQHFYTYSFLDDQYRGRGRVAGYVIGILVAMMIVFVLVFFLIRLRLWITETKCGYAAKTSSRDPVRHQRSDDVESVEMARFRSEGPSRANEGAV